MDLFNYFRRETDVYKRQGLKPFPISLDNYFVDREETPLDENGNYDYESLYALDLELRCV